MMTWCALLLLMTGVGAAQEPLRRTITRADGLNVNYVRDINQDSTGRIVVGTSVGVSTWDGDRARQADGGKIRSQVHRVERFGPHMVGRDEHGRVWLIDGVNTAQLLVNGSPLRTRDIAWTGSELAYLDADGALWTWVPGSSPVAHPANVPNPMRKLWGRHNVLLMVGTTGWFRVQGTKVASLDRPYEGPEDGLITSDGAIWASDGQGVWELSPEQPPVQHLPLTYQRSALAERKGSVWMAARSLAHFTDAGPRIYAAEPELHDQGDALFVDSEGSIWTGGSQGLTVVVEPEVVRWTQRHGLSGKAPRRLAWHNETLWVNHWNSLSVVEEGAARVDDRVASPSRPCVDGDGVAWMVDGIPATLRRFDGQRTRVSPAPASRVWWEGCTTDADGFVWQTIGPTIFRARGENLTEIAPVPKMTGGTDRSLFTADGVLSFAQGRSFCQASIATLRVAEDWRCIKIPGEGRIADMAGDSEGRFWLVGMEEAVLVGDLTGFVTPKSTASLPGSYLTFVEPSPRGGVWIGGEGPILRVAFDDIAADWTVIERLDGLVDSMLNRVGDLIETPHGDVYISVWFAVIKVSAEARARIPPPPRVQLGAVFIDGKEVSEMSDDLDMPSADALLELRLAVTSYRSREDLRIRSRVDEQPWSAPSAGFSIQRAGLAPGVRRLEVAASRDGLTWGPALPLTVRVPLPWYGRWQLWALALMGVLGALGLVWRARVLLALREERMRTRVAMDLHDEVGAELGALRLLAGLLGRELPREQRTEVAARAIQSVSSLTTSVRGIVWSLQPARRDLAGLAQHLSERAHAALPVLEGCVHVRLDLPHHSVPLDLEVVRAIRLIVREALHNIAKHSQASEVWLTVEPASAGRWRVQLRDNGVGYHVEASQARGAGLSSMAERARGIRAALTLRSDGSGSEVALVFSAGR